MCVRGKGGDRLATERIAMNDNAQDRGITELQYIAVLYTTLHCAVLSRYSGISGL